MQKALVIGAGPAGLSAAYYGTQYDIKPIVHEADTKNLWPSKPCGEAIPFTTLEYLPKGIDKSFILNKIKRAVFYFNGEFLRELKDMPLLEGFVIDKKSMLEEIANAAIAEGAEIIWGKRFHIHEINAALKDYDYIIDASGRGYVARHFLNYDRYELIPVLQAYAKGDTIPEDTIVLWGVDKGYAWVFPRGNMYNVGVGGFYRNPNELRAILMGVLRHFKLDLIPNIRGSAVSVGGPIKKLVKGKLRVIGEAAGMVMPTTGEGIRFGLAAGRIVFRGDYENVFWREFGYKLINGKRVLHLLLRIKDKTKLARIVSDKTYYEFFEGTISFYKVLKVALSYLIRR